jgi:hypothetical protein
VGIASPPDLSAIGFGVVTGAEEIKGGTVPVWRVATGSGVFHVKAWSDASWDWRVAALAGAAQVEWAAWELGLDMAEPVVLAEPVGEQLVTVHRWVDGRDLVHDDSVSDWLGATMARLHTVAPPPAAPDDSLNSVFAVHPAEDWRTWINEAGEQALPWADDAQSALPSIIATTDLIERATAASTDLVGSHRDLLIHNVMVTADGFTLVDWDAAGPQRAWHEAVCTAHDFGRLGPDGKRFDADPEVMRSILAAYLAAGGRRSADGVASLAGLFGLMLSRLAYFMWVSLGHRQRTVDERQWATDYIAGAFVKLERRLGEAPELAGLVDSVR